MPPSDDDIPDDDIIIDEGIEDDLGEEIPSDNVMEKNMYNDDKDDEEEEVKMPLITCF